MNKENLTIVADFMEQHQELPFNMCLVNVPIEPNTHCGTAGCIAGFTAFIFPECAESIPGFLIIGKDPIYDVMKVRRKLELTSSEYNELCLCSCMTKDSGEDLELHDITREMAIHAIRSLVNTGVVDFAYDKLRLD